MRKPDEKPGQEGSSVSEDLTLTGPNSELLAVRIPKGLYMELETLAKASKRQLPEVIREILWFHAFPSYLNSQIKQLKEKEGAEESAAFYLSLTPHLSMFTHRSDELQAACEQVKNIEAELEVLRARLTQLDQQAKTAWSEFLQAANPNT